jgi:hypothetical protein
MSKLNNYLPQIKEEYTKQLVNMLTPAIYEGINSIYGEAKKVKDGEELKFFQGFLAKIPTWNEQMIIMEATRIKTVTPNADILEDLIRGVIQSNILLLTATDISDKQSVLKEFNINLNYNKFIHNVYIEVAKTFYNYPFLFFHKVPTLEFKKNQLKSHKLIKESIEEAIRKMLPLQLILKKYLGIMSEINDDKYLKSLVKTEDNKQYQLVSTNKNTNIDLNHDSDSEKKNQVGGVVQSQAPISLKEIYEQQKKAGLNSTSIKHIPITESKRSEGSKRSEVRRSEVKQSDKKVNLIIPADIKKPEFFKPKNESETSQPYHKQDGGIEEEFSNMGKDKKDADYKNNLNTVSEEGSSESNKKKVFNFRGY